MFDIERLAMNSDNIAVQMRLGIEITYTMNMATPTKRKNSVSNACLEFTSEGMKFPLHFRCQLMFTILLPASVNVQGTTKFQ